MRLFFVALLGLILSVTLPEVADAAPDCVNKPDHPRCGGETDPDTDTTPPTYTGQDLTLGTQTVTDPLYGWMHGDVEIAFSHGYTGVGSHLIIVDNHTDASSGAINGNLTETVITNREHGYWTSLQASLVAPGAGGPREVDWDSTETINTYFLLPELYVVNLSFGLEGQAGQDVTSGLGQTMWDSLVDQAQLGSAVFVKAAGNTNGGTVDGTFTVRTPRPVQFQDYLNLQLIDAPSAIFVGALDGNGTVEDPASIASYSTIAGNTPAVQDMFLVVGVDSAKMGGLAGTSFAAPIVSGYAAIVGSKWTNANATQVANQLLSTARIDTIQSYSVSVHGQGEADLSRALAPNSIN
jgi:hypothetical protein